jgi:uncharacterized protein
LKRYSPFFRFLLWVTLALHMPFAVVVHHVARPWAGPYGALACSATLVAALMALAPGRIHGALYDAHRSTVMVEAVDAPYFVHWCACVFTAPATLVILLVHPLVQFARGAAITSPVPPMAWAYGVGLVFALWGVYLRRRIFRVARLDIAVAGLPAAFDGYRIAHLSDLHIGAMTPKRRAARWVHAANRERADLAVVTGDMVTNGVAFHEDIAQVLGPLHAADGALVTMGNHDYFGEGEPLMSLLRARGLSVVRNTGVRIERAGASLYVAGVDDTWTKRADLEATLAGRHAGECTLLLAHDPELFLEASRRDVALTLSGHTHAGQVALPFLARYLSLSRLGHTFHVGLYHLGASTLYVHPGLGTTGPPIRFGTTPTVAILTLRRAH